MPFHVSNRLDGGLALQTADLDGIHSVRRSRRTPPAILLVALGLLATSACDPNGILPPDPSLAELVGRWDATVLRFVDPDGLEEPIDALAQGVTFFINIEPSGTYTAIATGGGSAATEIGILTYRNGALTLTSQFPRSSVSEAEINLSGDTMEITGGSVLSFVPSGSPEIIIEMTLTRR